MTKVNLAPIRYWLMGKEYFTAHKAMEYASKFHTGVRKDGSTPEFEHQLTIVYFIKTLLPYLIHPEETIAAGWLHDVPEDYDVGHEEIEAEYGKVIRNAVELLTKKHRGTKLPTDVYYAHMAGNPIASLVKGVDRIHNQQSMQGTFDYDKQERYITETETFILPMLKEARRNFPEQEPAYENIKMVLKSQIQLIKAIHEAANEYN